MLTKVPKFSTVFIIVGHQKSFYHFGNVELFRCLSSNKFLVDNLSEMYETHKRAEIPEPPGTRTRIWSLPAVEPRIFFGVCIRVNCIHRAKVFCWYRLWVPLRVPTTPSTYCALYGRRCAKTRGRVRTWKFTIRTRTRALISLPVPAPWSAVLGTGTGKRRIGYPCMTLVLGAPKKGFLGRLLEHSLSKIWP